MISFLNTNGLWALSAIAVPIFIHLWNVKQGRTLKVGSVAFLTNATRAHSKSFKLTEWLLLLLRCFIIVALALLLAKPVLHNKTNSRSNGWILVERAKEIDAYKQYKPLIDSLLNQGYSFRYFEVGFPAGRPGVVSEHNDLKVFNHWSLLKQLNHLLPAGFPLYIFATNETKNVKGQRAAVDLQVNWNSVAAADTMTTFIAEAYENVGDSIRVIAGKSSKTGISFITTNTAIAGGGEERDVVIENGRTFVVDGNSKVEVDTATNRIVVYTTRASDASYLVAAFKAIQQLSQRKLSVTVVSAREDIPGDYQWLFWLSDEVVPASLNRNNVFSYARGNVQQSFSLMQLNSDDLMDGPVEVYKMVAGARKGKTVWSNSYGEPLLTVERRGANIYYFYSRFNPSWNGLVWNVRFPQILANLMYPAKPFADFLDNREIDQQQVIPLKVKGAPVAHKQNSAELTQLDKLFWSIAFILFAAERMISFYNERRQRHG